jgi:hypothetical protein
MNIGTAALAGILAVAAGCGQHAGTGPSPSATTSERLAVALTTAHFRILAGTADPAVLRSVADALESNYARITTELRTGDISATDVWVWQDSSSFYSDMQQTIGQLYQGSTGWVRGAHAVSVLVTSNTPLHAVHEFSHVVSMAVNASIANNPRWLWETVALYENRQFVDPASLEYMRAGRFPTLAELDSDFNAARQIYDLGFVLGEFVVTTWGMDSLLGLIRSNGRLEQTLGISSGEFEQRWHAWLRSRYLS